MTLLRVFLTVIFVISISGCVGAGVMYSNDKEESVSLTKSEIKKQFGEPLKIKSGQNREVWYYKAKDESINGFFIGLGIPLPLFISVDEKVIVEFEGETATKLIHKNSQQKTIGAFCKYVPALHHGSDTWSCHLGEKNGAF
ncbi:hypothetical protein L1264_02705 [Pseudoalteromonas sp. APAL1]|uniref:hypothetical protein n=1 Tax=Pseudoalteromonas TaxID=53246 RepID=UPI000EE5C1B5|nr:MULTISPECIES: hypothetical protein [unclassified Pseudoalteromonas]MCF2919395.1 hypothetical protein [Pseudoalteromonas sp. APAL1]HCV04161.1 hypothetical protein [Pseudoalteromonas sp.]|tara:strand:- start:2213 stop:2635 length:423 start_codon:yes stop_codon:yes gene_type:complete